MQVWDATVDAAVDRAIDEVLTEFPGSQVSIRDVLDDRGVVAVLVTAGDGRLVVAARSVDLVPVAWPWPGGVAATFGLLPKADPPTTAEVIAGLVAP